MSLQGVFNTRLSDKIGLYESNLFVQGTAFLFSLAAVFFLGKGNFGSLMETNKLYWLGGLLGLAITITVMLSIKGLGPAAAILIILVSQLFVAAAIEFFGLFGTEKMTFHWSHFAGLLLMIAGIILFKYEFHK